MPPQQPFSNLSSSALTSTASDVSYTDLVNASFDAKASFSDEAKTSLDSTMHSLEESITEGGLGRGDFRASGGMDNSDSGEMGLEEEEEMKMRSRGKEGGKKGMGPRREARMKGERTGRGKRL